MATDPPYIQRLFQIGNYFIARVLDRQTGYCFNWIIAKQIRYCPPPFEYKVIKVFWVKK